MLAEDRSSSADRAATTAASRTQSQASAAERTTSPPGAWLWTPSRRGLFVSWLALVVTMAVGLELLLAQQVHWEKATPGSSTAIRSALVGSAAALGVWWALSVRHRSDKFSPLATALLVWSGSATFSVAALVSAFRWGGLSVALTAVGAIQAAALSASAVLSAIALGRPALRLGAVAFCVQPVVLVPTSGLLIALVVGLSRAGINYSPAVVGLLLSALAAQLDPVRRYLFRTSLRPAWLLVALGTATSAIATLVAVSRWLPLDERRHYSGQVLYAAGDQNSQRVVFATHPAGLEVFVDHRAHLSVLDSDRYYRAMTRPLREAALSQPIDSVLLLGPGSGLWASRLLSEFDQLESLVVVTPSLELAELMRNKDLNALSTIGWQRDPRVELVERDLLEYLTNAKRRYHCVLADLPAPLDYRSSKFYTTHFVSLVNERLLPSGFAVTPAFSPSRTPDAHQAVQALFSDHSFEVRVASLPSLGDWALIEWRPKRGDEPSFPKKSSEIRAVSSLHDPIIGRTFLREFALNNDMPITD